MTVAASDILYVMTPELPDLAGGFGRDNVADRLFLENCADRLTTLDAAFSTRLAALDAVTMSLDGLTYRLTLKKGLFFHCGAEMTANDAVETVRRIVLQPGSASQLHRYVAKDKEGRHEAALYAVSRYRFEIRLTTRLPDLLARLALPELALRHDGKTCFSGAWRLEPGVATSTPHELRLVIHDKHPEAAQCQYKGIVWRVARDLVGLPTKANDDAVVAVYPGTLFKSPPEEMLAEEICRPLAAGFSVLIKLDARKDEATELRARIAQAAKAAFGKPSLWLRTPLTTLVPREHALHAPFLLDQAPAPAVGARRLRLHLDLGGAEALVPPQALQEFCRAAHELQGLDVTLGAASAAASAGVARGVLTVVSYEHPGDVYTPPARLGVEPAQLPNVLKAHGLAPFLSIPLVLRGNRNIRPRETTGLMHFADVRQSHDRLRKARVKDATLKSLGAALQMFVHDVRRPFSMVQGLLGLLEAAESPARQKELASRYLPELKHAVTGVDRMIQDILEIGSDAEPAREPTSIRALIDRVVREVFAAYEEPAAGGLTLDYRLDHRHLADADPGKVARVLTNLLTNAIEAMPPSGRIWFATEEDTEHGLLLVTVGNTGSFIPEAIRGGIFDRFFTEGKKRGTGLGLAIVKKIVNDHGGDVWCESDPEAGTRFLFNVPLAATRIDHDHTSLPSTAAAARSARRLTGVAVEDLSADPAHVGPAQVLLVDDSPATVEMIEELMTRDERRATGVVYTRASTAEAALTAAANVPFDLAVVDFDLGEAGSDGLQLLRALRRRYPRLRLCLHSNGSPFELQRRALEAGADLFLPKPMAREHLLRLLRSLRTAAATLQPPAPASAAGAPRIAVVDDDALILETWEAQPGYTWLTYTSPTALLTASAADPELLPTLAAVVIDYTFPPAPADSAYAAIATGADLAKVLQAKRRDLPLFLSTDRPLAALPPAFTRRLAKDAALGARDLARLLPVTRRGEGPP